MTVAITELSVSLPVAVSHSLPTFISDYRWSPRTPSPIFLVSSGAVKWDMLFVFAFRLCCLLISQLVYLLVVFICTTHRVFSWMTMFSQFAGKRCKFTAVERPCSCCTSNCGVETFVRSRAPKEETSDRPKRETGWNKMTHSLSAKASSSLWLDCSWESCQ